MRYGLCCIVLELQERKPPLKFQTMTYSSFSSMERSKALSVLGSRILNNMKVTLESIKFCHERNYCYRLSSDLFPLVTYEKASASLEDLPSYDSIHRSLNEIRTYVSDNPTRISCHPDQFNVLASENEEAVSRTIKELNFQSRFMDSIGCPADYRSPINIHMSNNSGSRDSIVDRMLSNMDRLDSNCRARLVLENDDKASCWSAKMLMEYYHKRTGSPITFDYLHHKCHPDGLSEKEAISMCHSSWRDSTPLFHFSESRDESNLKAHADYPSLIIDRYGLDFDLDFEFKMKDKAIERYKNLISACVSSNKSENKEIEHV
jgi:UV DNA damage endonuclease